MGKIQSVSTTFTRPTDTNVYAAGDLVANSTTAGSVTPMTLAFPYGQNFAARNITLKKTKVDITNASFNNPLGLAVAADGRVDVSNFFGSSVSVIDPVSWPHAESSDVVAPCGSLSATTMASTPPASTRLRRACAMPATRSSWSRPTATAVAPATR